MSVAKRDLEDNRKVTTHRLIEMKQRGEKISMLTAYDYSMAQLIDQAGMDVILVGDSASNVMAGNVTTLPITLDQMIYHGKSVMKAVKACLGGGGPAFWHVSRKLKRSVGFGHPCDEGNACGLY